ncbi:MAG: type II toxin-antitoxin system RelE/ParE family toxin [Candidatus Aminicenantes bacterium]|nr:type II toxin-antitoxin system RelE/ParE family toxin [Candidatus Aminicenantes bacterium]
MEKSIKKTKWTNPAKKDLRNIFEYLSQFSKNAALRVINKILDKVELLEEGFTEIGQQEPLLEHKPDVYRYLVEGNYKIIYRVKGRRVIIATVFDVRQNPDKLEKIVD